MDLSDLVSSTGKDVPDVLVQCTTFIEKHGLVDGVYRISGISSNIKRLKYENMKKTLTFTYAKKIPHQ